MYTNTKDFCILNLYLTILLTSFISSNIFLFFDFICIISCHLQKNWSFTSSLLIWMHFNSFFYLIAVARTFSTMLSRYGQSGHPCLVHDLRGKASSFSPLSISAVLCSSFEIFHPLPLLSPTTFYSGLVMY